MSATASHQLFLLADHLKLSLLERQRALSLNIQADKQDGEISRSLSNLQQGIEQLEAGEASQESHRNGDPNLAKLKSQYQELYNQFHGNEVASPEVQKPNDAALAKDFAAAQSAPSRARQQRNVRFRDNPDAEEEDPVEVANRAALFSDQERYRDEPSGPDQEQMDNQQIHAYHKQVILDQDEQLNALSLSVGRQRMLGIQIGSELEEQNELLTDVESGVDRHSSTLERARKRLGDIARKSRDNWNWLTIGILIVILVLLIVVLN